MSDLRVVGPLDRNFAWIESRLAGPELCEPGAPVPAAIRGAYAGVGAVPPRYRLVRDPLGLNKLFWAATADGSILVAARPRRLVEAGCPLDAVRAVPAGVVVDLDFSTRAAQVVRLAAPVEAPADASAPTVEQAAEGIRHTLDEYLDALSRSSPDTRAFVCLSGGLDSSGVAVLARRHFQDLTAVSFDLRHADGEKSDDRRTAERLARDLALPLLCVTVGADELLDELDRVLVEAIDWRDFNVHAGLVNAALAGGLAAAVPEGPEPRLVLTGDLMNEFLVDYQAETYRDRVYYRLPRLPPAELREALVKGLQTTHREVGPFEARGLPVVQPYAAAAPEYAGLPASFLLEPDRKPRLTRLVAGDAIPSYVFTRGKTRAQVGGADQGRGVLALCVDRGIDERWLRQRFAELHGAADAGSLDRFLRAGRYRCAVPLAG
jgi:asparagine synthetase B (glutamine-hydrolysing)